MKTFKEWLLVENSNKNVLLLIHPDCVFELGTIDCIEYEKKLKDHVQKFDHIISHLFWPKSMLDHIKNKRPEDYKVLDSIINTIKSISDTSTPQNGPDDCSYNRELPDYLINNENVKIFMAGGYEDNCLWRSYIEMFKKLDWIIKEKNISVQWYEPLIFKSKDYKLKNIDDKEIQFDRSNLKSIQPTPSNFSPKKVDYGEPL